MSLEEQFAVFADESLEWADLTLPVLSIYDLEEF